jgi:hypothetical protein
MRAISCCCAGDGPGLRRAPTRRFPPGGCGRGARESRGRGPGGWSSPGAGDPGAGPTENLGQGEVTGSGGCFGQGEAAGSDVGFGQGEAAGSGGGLAPDGGFGHGERPRPEEALDSAEGRVFGGGAEG